MQLQNCTNVLPKVVSNNGILKQMAAKNLQTFMNKLHHRVKSQHNEKGCTHFQEACIKPKLLLNPITLVLMSMGRAPCNFHEIQSTARLIISIHTRALTL